MRKDEDSGSANTFTTNGKSDILRIIDLLASTSTFFYACLSPSMGDSCSKLSPEHTERSHTAMPPEEDPPRPPGGGGGSRETVTAGTAVASSSAFAPTRKRRDRRPSGPRTRSLIRVNSRRMPNSPARASNYGHVATAVYQNFSEALSGQLTPGGDSTGVTVPLGVVGLRNLGNTCFLNSSLQCLAATIPLTDYFLGYDYRKELNMNNPLGTGGRLAVQYAELMKAMWLGPTQQQQQQHKFKPPSPSRKRGGAAAARSTANAAAIIKPSSFKSALETFAPHFVGCRQHDAQELLAYLLDGIHEDLNRIHLKPYVEDPDFDGTNDERDAATAWKNYLQRDKSLIVDIFQGQVKNKRQCCTCRHVNVKFEPFMYLSVPISDRCRTLDDCVNLYLKEERLDRDNQWYCAKCKTHRDAIQKTTLWILPPILIVHLKRFRFNDYGHLASKNTAPIDYPFTWDLTKFVKHGGMSHYGLYAVSNHVGGMGSGHYTAYGKNRFDDAWYEFNDANCRKVTEHTLEQNRSSAYLLFYNRIEEAQAVPNIGKHAVGHGLALQRAPLIRRQSVSRPDLWPHAQVTDSHFREFARQSARSSFPDPPPLFASNDMTEERIELTEMSAEL